MRSAIIAGAAALALSTMVAPASAGGFWFLGKTISLCVLGGVIGGVPQVQCAENLVDHHGRSNDWNTQRIRQRQNAEVDGGPVSGTLQLQIGRNYVKEGDGNYQKIKQYQDYDGTSPSGVQQLQVGSNVVLDGDHNTQTIKQSQTLNVGYEPCVCDQ